MRQEAEFPFADAPNTAVFTCCHVLDGKKPILSVAHVRDGDWQFLCGGQHTEKDGRIVSLFSVYQADPGVGALAGMPCGFYAECEDEDNDWMVRREE